MKAIQVQKTGGPEVLTLVDLPIPKPKANEAVVKIAASGVNFIDVYFREGRYPATLPFTDGQEAAGTVTEVGSEVKSVKAGDRVAYSNVVGTYAEYAAVPAERLVHVPDKITDQQAAAAMLQGMTAHYLSHTTHQLKQGDTVLIHAAAGGVGLLLVQMAKNIGARVIGTAGSEEKAKLAREAGADEVIVYTNQDFEAETKRLTEGKGVHVVYDGVGQTTFDKGLNVLRPRGHMVLFGASSGPVPAVDPIKQLMAKGSLTLTRPSLIHYVSTREELQQRAGDVFAMIGTGKLKLRISRTYKLEEVQQAHRDLEGRRTTGKILLVP
jgi:NADPH2:quinone reductase